MMRTGRNAMRSAGIDARNGALGKRFDASYKRHPVTESSYINRLANRPYRSTVKTLPATLPEPWTTVRGPSSKHRGPRTLSRDPGIASRGSSFAAPAWWTPNRGYWGKLLDLDRIGSRGGVYAWGWSCLGPWAGDGWVETKLPFFICLPHLVLKVGVDVTYSVFSCTAPR